MAEQKENGGHDDAGAELVKPEALLDFWNYDIEPSLTAERILTNSLPSIKCINNNNSNKSAFL